jgi:hypothetical protein
MVRSRKDSARIHHIYEPEVLLLMSTSRGDENATAAVRINPYSVKKVAPPLFRKPLVEFDDFEDEMTNEKPVTTDKESAAAATPMQEEAAIAAPMSVSLPLWKRLPSKSISFGSSEVLTVSEVCQHGLLYSNANHSIRTTGVLRQKIFYPLDDGTNYTESDQVSLLLEDPLAKVSRTGNTRSGPPPTPAAVISTAKDRGRRISFGPQTPAAHLQRSARGSNDLVTPGVPKTPFTTKKLASRTPLQFRTPGLSSSRKRPFPKVVCPKEILANALASNPTATIWVVVDPQHVSIDHISVGDLVTVFGTVHTLMDESCPDPSAVPPRISSFCREVARLVVSNKQQPSEGVRFVQGRILRQDNGASPRLHWEALKLRRKHLLKTYYQHQQPSEDVTLLGCGPPPYDWGTTEKSSGNDIGVNHS